MGWRGSLPPRAWVWPPGARGGGVCWNPSPQGALEHQRVATGATALHCSASLRLAPLHTGAKSELKHTALQRASMHY